MQPQNVTVDTSFFKKVLAFIAAWWMASIAFALMFWGTVLFVVCHFVFKFW